VEGHNDQGKCQHDDSIVESLASVFLDWCTSGGAASILRSAHVATDFASFLGGESDRVNGGEGRFTNIEVLTGERRKTLFDERWSRRTASLRAATKRSSNASSGAKKRCGLIHDTCVVVDGIVVVNLLRVGLFQEEDSLDDSKNDDDDGNQVGKKVWVLLPEGAGSEKARVESGWLCEESTHSRSKDATKGPDEWLHGIRLGCENC